MSDRENSVLFSLKELRMIEDDRVKQEEAAARQKLEDEKRAKEEAIRLAKEEEERKVREEQDRVAALEAEKHRAAREDQLRLEEAERKARVEAQAKLEEARIQAEIHARALHKGAPTKAIVGAVGGVIALAGGILLYVFMVVIPQREADQEQRFEARMVEAVKDQQAGVDRKIGELIAQEQDEKKREALRAQAEAEKRRLAEELRQKIAARRQQHPVASSNSNRPNRPSTVIDDKCKGSSDPLCGMN